MGLWARLGSLRKAGARALVAKVRRRLTGNPAIPQPPAFAAVPTVPPGDPTSVRDLLDRRFRDLQPIPAIHVETAGPRLTLVVDALEGAAHAPFDGEGEVSAALVLATLAARANGMPLRIVARRTPARARVVLDALARQGIPPAPDVSYFSDVGRDGGGRQRYKLETGTRDLFLATSWRSAAACRATSFAPRTTWLVRDDEAALLPAGDDRALCEALLADDSIDFAVETRELFDALAARYPAVARNGIPYEPAFPRPAPEAPATAGASTASTTAGRRRRLLFVARPEEPATLYALGLAALDRALADGVLDPAAWEFLCIGSPAPVLRFSDGTRATVLDPDRKGYDELLSGVDLILAPHATARTGGIALEAAAHGAVVVSTRASATPGPAARRGPVAAEPTVDALVAALRAGAALVDDPARRAVADAPEAWESGFAAVLVRFAERAAHA